MFFSIFNIYFCLILFSFPPQMFNMQPEIATEIQTWTLISLGTGSLKLEHCASLQCCQSHCCSYT